MRRFAALFINIFSIGVIYILTVTSGCHTAYQDVVVTYLNKYYPNPDTVARSILNIVECFWQLDLSYKDD